jgi:hypothetical protein
MGACARLGEGGHMRANRFCGPADMSAFLNSDCAHFGEAARRGAERAGTGGHVPAERGV